MQIRTMAATVFVTTIATTIAAASIGTGTAAASPAQGARTVKATSVPAHTTTVVGKDPFAAAQPTAAGHLIRDLGMANGKLYVAYGDYDANTGPQQVHTFDPSTGVFSGSLLEVPTEEISTYRKINSAMYAPMTDPRVPWTADAGYATNATGSWTNQMKAPENHIFDVATLTGSDLWMVGSVGRYDPAVAGGGAAAYRSTDGGQTWQLVAKDTSAVETGYERYYWAAAINGTMYLQASGVSGGAPLRAFNGTTWSTVSLASADQPCGTVAANRVEVFKNMIVCAGGSAYGVTTFDGVTAKTAAIGGLSDLAVPGDGSIYALTTNGVYRSIDGRSWTPLSTAPAGAQSVAVVNGTVYLGMNDSTIVKINKLTVSPAPSATTQAARRSGPLAPRPFGPSRSELG